MTRLDLSNNDIGGRDDEPGVHALADMLMSNTTLKELNISSNDLDEECAQILAPAISDNGGISTFTFSGSVDDEESEPVTMETSMVEADFSGKGLGLSGAIMVAAFLPKCT
jgi:hypothetical protein